ncbi:magnesium chelatase domain-containing protein [Hippea alviniae]|uniref:magnesium chelatase domain-containing protein n=1 Tax=Hippea alviniae TaxID=1279027 RepID=UPI0003B3618E|nr:magnesium chelatase domain-containing protein [Hippea alviniae]
MFISLKSAVIEGIDAIPISIEIDAAKGLPSLNIIGLASGAAKESKDRAIHVLKNSGIELPPKKITINLAPADLKKETSAVDLPIALGLASISENLKIDTEGFLFAAELSLNGILRPVKGIFPMGVLAKEKGLKLIVSKENEKEAALSGVETYGFDTFSEVLGFLLGKVKKNKSSLNIELVKAKGDYDLDFADVKGQFKVKRAITIAAAGFHNVLMIGTPGVGKSMIAKRIPTILPEMSEDEILTTTKIYSVCGFLNNDNPIITTRPFRAPHSGSSDVSLIGGGCRIHYFLRLYKSYCDSTKVNETLRGRFS